MPAPDAAPPLDSSAESQSAGTEEAAEPLAKRLRRCAERAGGTAALSRKAAIPRTILEHYLVGAAEPRASRAGAIAEAAGVSGHWLLTGSGPIERAERPGRRAYGAGVGEDYALVSVYEPISRAGRRGLVDETEGAERADALAFRRRWLEEVLRADPEDLVVVYIDEEATALTLSPGQIALVDVREKAVRGSGLYLMEVGSAPTIRRLERLPSAIRVWAGSSGSEAVELPPCAFEDAEIVLVGRLVWADRRL